MFDMNSQSTNAGNGSNLSDEGARVFHDSHRTVQPKINRKKPMVPTRFVIQRAARSSPDRLSRCSMFTRRIGGRCFLISVSLGAAAATAGCLSVMDLSIDGLLATV